MKHLFLLLIWMGWGWTLHAQLDSTQVSIDTIALNINRIEYCQKTVYLKSNNALNKQYTERTWFDTTGVMTKQERTYYEQTDTGIAIARFYAYTYQPANRLGEFYTERFPTPSKARSYSKKATKFQNDNRHPTLRKWEKIYKVNSRQILRQITYEYDKNGYLTSKTTSNYNTTPTSSTIEKVERNAAGNMLRWTSYDDDGDTKMQARDFTASYLEDSLLLQSYQQLYYGVNQTIHKYTRNKQLRKTIQQVGNLVRGKPKWTTKTTICYKDGRPFRLQEKHLNKTVKKIEYNYAPHQTTQVVISSEGNYTDTQTWTYHDSFPKLPTQYVETKKGKPFVEKKWKYTATGKLLQYIQFEHRANNKDWKEIDHYNDRGQIYWHQFFINDQLNKEERLQYRYYPPVPFPD